MADGNATPGAFDGMECFKSSNGTVRLVRNHETRAQDGVGGAPAPANSNPYDPACNGGTTTIEVDLRGNPQSGGEVSSWQSLSGAYFNCSGGESTYRTWFSCEELQSGSDMEPTDAPDPFPGGHDVFGNGGGCSTSSACASVWSSKHHRSRVSWGPGTCRR